MKTVIVLACLPVLAFPWLLSLCPAGSVARPFLILYPVYVAVSALCAWICRRDRREISWILVVLMLLTHAAIWVLCTSPAIS